MLPVALTIAGSDPSAGAGLQADLKTFHTHRVYGTAVVSLLTVQNTRGVQRVELVPAPLVAAQLAALWGDLPPRAVKTGALGGAAQVEAVAGQLAGRDLPLVVDPVCVSKSGAELLDAQGRAALVRRLFPLATLVTPNLDEARLLLEQPIDDPGGIPAAAQALQAFGARAVLLKGGHRAGDPIDVLCVGQRVYELHAPRVRTVHTHGVGCTLSAAIAARLALGFELVEACRLAKRWVSRALESAPGLGAGQGPLDHFAPLPEAEA